MGSVSTHSYSISPEVTKTDDLPELSLRVLPHLDTARIFIKTQNEKANR